MSTTTEHVVGIAAAGSTMLPLDLWAKIAAASYCTFLCIKMVWQGYTWIRDKKWRKTFKEDESNQHDE